MIRTPSTANRHWIRSLWAVGMVMFMLLFAACQATAPAAPAAEPAATEAPAAEPTATEAPQEEAAATEAPQEEAMPSDGMVGDAANGQYIATLTGGCGCHFNRDLGALAGGNKFEGGFGVAYAANITPDPETGIGNFTEADIAHILLTGARPDGSQLVPAMPYMAFSAMSQQEAHDVAAYLLSLDPVVNEVPAREVTNEPAPFTPATESPMTAPTDPVARGQELVTIARCGMCHTPRNDDGSVNTDMLLAGAPLQGTDEYAHNITPDDETGIGLWSEEETAAFLRTGTMPDGDQVDGAMAQQIDRRFSKLTEEDALAIAAYLKSIPAVSSSAP